MDNKYIFDMYDKMFALPAWKDLVEDFKQRQDNLAKYMISNQQATEKELYRAQGINQIYQYIVTLESSMEAAKKAIEEDNAANTPAELPNV